MWPRIQNYSVRKVQYMVLVHLISLINKPNSPRIDREKWHLKKHTALMASSFIFWIKMIGLPTKYSSPFDLGI